MKLLAVITALTPMVAGAQSLPFLVGGDYALTNQNGQTHTQADPDGRAQLLFFGYANCLQICSSVVPQIADITNELAAQGHAIWPVMVTVDRTIDTVDAIGPRLTVYHDDFVGLTGSDMALQVACDAFSIEKEFLFDDAELGPVYAHVSFMYLLDGSGKMLMLIPLVLSDEYVNTIITKYIG